MKKVIFVGFVILYTCSLFAQTTARVDSFYMASLGRTKKFSVILPTEYNSTSRYPVLYLLHGYSGSYDNWSALTRIAEYVKTIPLIVVMPDGENSWYINSATEPQDRFEDYIVNDLPAYIQKLYSVDTTRQAIAGLSMGGYGALMLALKHPSKYRFAGGLSSAITYPREISDSSRTEGQALIPSLRKAFGDHTNGFRNAHDVFYLYKQTPKTALPYVYMSIGIQDGFRRFLPAHRAFTDLLRTYGAPYEYHETQGGHTWKFWDREIQPLLVRLREVLKF